MAAMRSPKDWTQGSVTRNLLTLSWPMMVTEGLYMLGISIDMIWVGRISTGAIAGIGVAGIFAGFQMMIMTGFGIGTRAVVARFVGAGDIEGANHAAQQAFVICVIYTVVMMALGLIFAEPVLRLMGFTPEVVTIGSEYVYIMFGLGSVTVAFWYMGYSIIQASGDAITPMVIIILYRLLPPLPAACRAAPLPSAPVPKSSVLPARCAVWWSRDSPDVRQAHRSYYSHSLD